MMFKASLLNFTIIFIFRYSSLSCGKVLSNIIYLMKYCHPVNSKMLLSISGKCVFPTLTWFRLSWPSLGPNDWWQTGLSQPDPPYCKHNSWPNKVAKTRYLLPYVPLDKQRVPPSSHLCKIKLWRTRGIPKRMQDAINLQCVGHLLGVVARSLTHSPELMLLTWAVAAAFHKNRKTPAGGSTSCGSGAGSGSGWVVVTQSQPARWRHYNDNLSKLRLAPPKKRKRRLCCLAALCNLHFSRGQLQLQIESQRQKLSLATRQKPRAAKNAPAAEEEEANRLDWLKRWPGHKSLSASGCKLCASDRDRASSMQKGKGRRDWTAGGKGRQSRAEPRAAFATISVFRLRSSDSLFACILCMHIASNRKGEEVRGKEGDPVNSSNNNYNYNSKQAKRTFCGYSPPQPFRALLGTVSPATATHA